MHGLAQGRMDVDDAGDVLENRTPFHQDGELGG